MLRLILIHVSKKDPCWKTRTFIRIDYWRLCILSQANLCVHVRYSSVEKHIPLQWRHNGCDSVSNHQPYDYLLNCTFRRISKKTSKLRLTGLCNSPHKWPVTRKIFPFDGILMCGTVISTSRKYTHACTNKHRFEPILISESNGQVNYISVSTILYSTGCRKLPRHVIAYQDFSVSGVGK